MMQAFASNTQGRRNLDALRAGNFGILLTPGKHSEPPAWCDLHAIDNGCWKIRDNPDAFEGTAFEQLCLRHGSTARFVVVPDKVFRGKESLDFSIQWLPFCSQFRRPLLAVQDGMKVEDVGAVLERFPALGIFLGGSTDWKLSTLYRWGTVAHAFRRYFHVGRVNTAKRIRLCAEAGADSFDGTSATMFSCTVPLLNSARKQPSLLTPAFTGASL